MRAGARARARLYVGLLCLYEVSVPGARSDYLVPGPINHPERSPVDARLIESAVRASDQAAPRSLFIWTLSNKSCFD